MNITTGKCKLGNMQIGTRRHVMDSKNIVLLDENEVQWTYGLQKQNRFTQYV